MTKKDDIIRLAKLGWKNQQIAAHVGCDENYVCVVKWRERNPTYAAEWVRQKRAEQGPAP